MNKSVKRLPIMPDEDGDAAAKDEFNVYVCLEQNLLYEMDVNFSNYQDADKFAIACANIPNVEIVILTETTVRKMSWSYVKK